MKISIVKLFLILVLLIVTLLTSCTRDEDNRIEELEKRVATLEEETTVEASVPKIIEKTIQTVLRTVGYPEWQENQSLDFQLEIGDKINGEVIVIGGTANDLICTVRDPYGNVLTQSSTRTEYFTITSLESGKQTLTRLVSTQQYPWKFAFIASTTGEHTLEIYREISSSDNTTGANLKVTIN